jgi:Ni,Fe-hydrogenase I small subunit
MSAAVMSAHAGTARHEPRAPGEPLRVLWLQSGGCGGCSMSLLCADTPDLPGTLRAGGIDLLWHPSLSLQSGAELIQLLNELVDGSQRLDVLCIEGALLRGPNGSGRFHMLAGTGLPMIDWVQRLAQRAGLVVAVGACAAWGGITAGGDNPTEACGLQFDDDRVGGLLGEAFHSSGCATAHASWPVINIAGCPTHPGWVLDTLMALALDALTPADLDALGRPRFYADQLVHHGCTRNEYYEFKASAEQPSDQGCMMEHMGCKGTQAHADCNTRLWNGEGSCTRGGYACISCTEPGFQEPGHAFHTTPKIAGIPMGLPTDMPKAWFVALASLSKSATPKRVKHNATADHIVVPPAIRKTRLK